MGTRDVEIKEAFCLFDTDADGRVCISDLALVLRSLGVNPSDFEITQRLRTRQGHDALTYQEFYALWGDKLKEVDQQKQLLQAFQVFDPSSSGSISASELKHVLLTLGSRLTVADIDELLLLGMNGKGCNDDRLHYKDFVELLLSKANGANSMF